MKRKIILPLLATILLAVLIGAYLYFKQTPDVVGESPDMTVTVDKLISDFENDTAAARQMYLDKIVEVTGNVKSIDTAGALVLGQEGSPSEVVVGLDRRHLQDYQQLQVGSTVVVQGVCSGFSSGGSADPDDLLADLGTTVQLRSAGIKNRK